MTHIDKREGNREKKNLASIEIKSNRVDNGSLVKKAHNRDYYPFSILHLHTCVGTRKINVDH